MIDSNIEIFKTESGETEILVRMEDDTVWLTQKQMSTLFEKDSDTIGLHIKNIYHTGELEEFSTTEDFSVVRLEGNRKVKRKVKHYNLDTIISVGYRVNSLRGIQFRRWATSILKDYLIKGFCINETKIRQQKEQLKELQNSVKILGKVLNYKTLSNDESIGLLKIISDYAYALEILDQYDYQTLEINNTSGKETFQLTYTEAFNQIMLAKKVHGNSELFGREKDESFRSSIASIFQTIGGNDVYPSIEEKAANLLYFITKNHSFTDGNKRIAAFLFLYFLERNGILFDQNGNKRIADNTLVALTLMIAVSKSDEKDMMTKVIVNLINRNN